MASFDSIAGCYDRIWTESAVGEVQRRVFWKAVDPLFRPGDHILDLGCGTGADAVHFGELGIRVCGIDRSPQMVGIAQSKGVEALLLDVSDLAQIGGRFDGAISNFGALNCIESLSVVAEELARLVRPGGFLALCFLGRVCLWEIGYYLLRGDIGKAGRRLRGRANSSRGRVFYPSERTILGAFRKKFLLMARLGIGIAVPPSYVSGLSRKTVARLATLDAKLASRPFSRSLADHRLYIWRRG